MLGPKEEDMQDHTSMHDLVLLYHNWASYSFINIPCEGSGGGLPKSSGNWQQTSVTMSPMTGNSIQETVIAEAEWKDLKTCVISVKKSTRGNCVL